MKSSLLLAALLVATSTRALPTASAGPAELDLQSLTSGELCSTGPVTYHPDGTASTVIRGGPLHATDPSASIWLLCTVQVDALTHDGPDAAGTRTWGVGSVIQEPTEVRFKASPESTTLICPETWIAHSSGHISMVHDGRAFTLDSGAACTATCLTLSLLAGSYAGGLVVIDLTGDVYIGGVWVWDCP
jgi:hypothetical protein